MTILRQVRARIGAWCDTQLPGGYPLDRDQTITLVSLVIDEIINPRKVEPVDEHARALHDAGLAEQAPTASGWLDEPRAEITEADALRVQLNAAVRDRESILRRYKRLAATVEAIRAWRATMAEPPPDWTVLDTLLGEPPSEGEPPAWVEQLASEWGLESMESHVEGFREAAEAYQRCAAELRARAKGEP